MKLRPLLQLQVCLYQLYTCTSVKAVLSSARAIAVALAKLPSCRAAAWFPTVGTVAFAAATILPAGWEKMGYRGSEEEGVEGGGTGGGGRGGREGRRKEGRRM